MEENISPIPSDTPASSFSLDADDSATKHVAGDLVDLALGTWHPEDVIQRATAALDHLIWCQPCFRGLEYLRDQIDILADTEPDRWRLAALVLRDLCETALVERAVTDEGVPAPAHPHDALPRYARHVATRGAAFARARQPDVAAHLESCLDCHAEFASLLPLLEDLPAPDRPWPQKERVEELDEARDQGLGPIRPTFDELEWPITAGASDRGAPAIRLRVAALVQVAVVTAVQSMQTVAAFVAYVTNFALKTAAAHAGAEDGRRQTLGASAPAQLSTRKPTIWIVDPTRATRLAEALHLAPPESSQPVIAPLRLPAYQLWADECVIDGEWIYLDSLPLLCAVSNPPGSGLVFFMPESETHRDVSVVTTVMANVARCWDRFAAVPWRYIATRSSGQAAGVMLGAHRPLPGEPWRQQGVARGALLRRRFFLRPDSRQDTPQPPAGQLTGPWLAAPGRFDLTGEGSEADGLANFVLGMLHEQQGGAEHMETAIAYYEHALHYFPPAEHPLHYAAVRRRLAAAYRQRMAGRTESNLRLAAETYAEAATLFKRNGSAFDWAMCRVNLGNVLSRTAGGRRDPLARAIRCYDDGLSVFAPDAHPVQYAATQGNLGATYATLAALDRSVSLLELAKAAIESALSVFTLGQFPAQYAMLQHRLGSAHHDVSEAQRIPPQEPHLQPYTEALRVYTPESYPVEYATVHLRLGKAYAQRVAAGHHDEVDKGLKSFAAASHILSAEDFPNERRQMRKYETQLRAYKQRQRT